MHCIRINAVYFPNGIEENNTGINSNDILMVTPNVGLTLLKPNCKYAKLSTDYFGGCGEQNAKIKKADYKFEGSINKVLRELDGKDEFDTIHLDYFRSEQDFLSALYEQEVNDFIEVEPSIILDRVNDIAINFLHYDRKNDDELTEKQLKDAIISGIITIDEIIDTFRKKLENELN
jgi:hypothetical protein